MWRGTALALGAAVAPTTPTSTLGMGTGVVGGSRSDWLRCTASEEIHWPSLRSTFETYADKYLEDPYRLAREAQLALIYSQQPIPHPAEAPCPLGDIALRLLMWVFLAGRSFFEAVELLPLYSTVTEYDPLQPPAMLADVLNVLWNAPLSWSDIIQSGWPIFSLLGQLNAKAWAGLGSNKPTGKCEEALIWGGQSYLNSLMKTFETGALLPVHASLSTLLAIDRAACPIAFSTVLLALADSVRWDALGPGNSPDGGRSAFYYRYAAMEPETAMADLREQVGSTYADDQEALLAMAENIIRSMEIGEQGLASRVWPAPTLLTAWPLWRLVDRVGCSEWVKVRTLPTQPTPLTRQLRSVTPSFYVHVYPHRVASDGLQSSRTRSRRRAYCAKEFQNELDMLRLRYGHGTQLRFVEVGAHLGDCLLWTAARVGCAGALRATGYEVVPQVMALVRKSVERNALWGCVQPRLAYLAETKGAAPNRPSVPALTLDEEVHEFVHILKVHTNGGEDAIIRGGRRLFSDPQLGVGILVVNSDSWALLGRLVDFLYSLGGPGYEFELRGSLLAPGRQEVTQAIHDAMADGSGSVQLIARRHDIPRVADRPWNLTASRGPLK